MADERRTKRKERLRTGFSTGTAAAAAARAALRFLLTGQPVSSVAVRLPAGYFLSVPVKCVLPNGAGALATVVKDGGDDPDVTHHAEIKAKVAWVRTTDPAATLPLDPLKDTLNGGRDDADGLHHEDRPQQGRGAIPSGIWLCAGEGVGHVTKPGLPVAPGEPAINPVPRQMIVHNLQEELSCLGRQHVLWQGAATEQPSLSSPGVLLAFPERWDVLRVENPLHTPQNLSREDDASSQEPALLLHVEIQVPRGEELARHTLNPRLGVVGGISILGTTGLVKPFSNQAYEETIHAALSVAASAGCKTVVLSTGGKSERFARGLLTSLPDECFVEIADFFGFSLQEAVRLGFRHIVHSAFFGKVVKMAQGHPYTHAHRVALELGPLAQTARDLGYEEAYCRELAEANTARHALEMLRGKSAMNVVEAVARQALFQSRRMAGEGIRVRLLVFDFDGALLTDSGDGR